MKRILCLFIAILMLSATVFAQATYTVSKGGLRTIDFETPFTENHVIEFDYSYSELFNSGNVKYKLHSNSGEVFRVVLSVDSGATTPTAYIYAKNSSSLKAKLSDNKGFYYKSVSVPATSGKLTFAVDLENQRVLIKNTDAQTGEVSLLTNDFLWGLNVTDISAFEIDATEGPGVNITEFNAFVPDEFMEYNHYAKKLDFDDLDVGYVVPQTGSEMISNIANQTTVASDPANPENNVIKHTGIKGTDTVFDVSPSGKFFGLTGNAYVKFRIRYANTSSVRTANIYQSGGYKPSYASSGTYADTHTILETFATGALFQAKENTNSFPQLSGRKINVWYDLEYYFNTDNDTVIMYVDGTPVAMKDEEGKIIEEFRPMRETVDFINLIRFTTNKNNTTFYIDDFEAGMYVPYSGISSDSLTIDKEKKQIKGLSESMTVEELVSAIATNGKLNVYNAYGEIKESGELTTGDYLIESDITGNLATKYEFPEVFTKGITHEYGVLDAENKTITAPYRISVEDYLNGIICDAPYTAKVLLANKSGEAQGFIRDGYFLRITVGETTNDFKVLGEIVCDFENGDESIKSTTGAYVSDITKDGNTCYRISGSDMVLNFPRNLTGKVSVSMDILYKTNTAGGNFCLRSGSDLSKNEIVKVTYANEELMKAYSAPNGSKNEPLTLSIVSDPSVWTHYTVEADLDAKTFMLYRNNVPAFSEPIAFFKHNTPLTGVSIDSLAGTEMYIDNISVHNFEPLETEISSTFNVDNEYKMITGIPSGTTVSELLGSITTDCNIEVWDKRGNEKTSGVLTLDDTLFVQDDFNKHCNYGLSLVDNDYDYKENFESINASTELYVSPSGSDENSGISSSEPFKTLNACAEYIKANKPEIPGDVVINMLGGTYEFLEAQRFSADCDLNGGKIVIQPYGNDKVVITGGKTVQPSEFSPVSDETIRARLSQDVRDKVVEYDMSGLDSAMFGSRVMSGWNLKFVPSRFEFYKNTELQPLSRYPDDHLTITSSIVDKNKSFTYSDARPETWLEPEKAWIWSVFGKPYGGHDIRIASVDAENNTITLVTDKDGKTMLQDPTESNFKYYYDNILEEITMPGEWYYDEATNKLYYYPDSEFSDSEFYISLLSDNVLSFYNVDNLYIKGLTFVGSRGDMLGIYDCNKALVENCTVSGAGMNGIIIGGGSNNFIIDSEVMYTGGDAVKITAGNIYTLTPSNSGVINCVLHDFSKRKKAYTGAVWAAGCGITIKNNSIYKAPHIGIQLKGNDITIENNTITNVGSNAKDMGAIYTYNNYVWRGNKILNNRFQDIRHDDPDASGNTINAIFLDNFSSGYEIKKNVFINCAQGISANGGRQNNVFGNVFYKTGKIYIFRDFHTVFDPPLRSLDTMPVFSELWRERYDGIEETGTVFPGTPYGTVLGETLLLDHPSSEITDKKQILIKDFTYSLLTDYKKINDFKEKFEIDELNMGADAKSGGVAERIIPVINQKAFEGTYDLKIGETVSFDAVVTGRAGKLTLTPEVEISNSQIAELSGYSVTGIKLGTTTLKFSYEDIETSIKIRVIK